MSTSDRRFQVFVSSTFRDLVDERKEVMQALLELDCIPSGMELFQAADEDQWSLIKRVIDDCDYYMVIVAGRYGSVSATGRSYTEMEYRYAVEQKKPVIAFLHEDPGKLPADKCETEDNGRQQLENFRKLCESRVVKYWNGPQSLGSVVSRSIVRLIKDRPATGWIRGSAVATDEANKEILRLRQQIDDLEAKIKSNATFRPEGTEDLLQDGDEIPARVDVRFVGKERHLTQTVVFDTTVPWNLLFFKAAPRLLEELSETDLEEAIDDAIYDHLYPQLKEHKTYKDKQVRTIRSDSDTFHKIKVQMIALGLITKGDRKRAVADTKTYWKLTPYGETKAMSALAMRRKLKSEFDEVLG